ncbi:MAG: hypothetical protein HFE78_04360 [Clostridiales bacterium]|nr:hypothetical protein [Clostridiales bacterium]
MKIMPAQSRRTPPAKRPQNRRPQNNRRVQTRRRRARPIYLRLGFWIAVCVLILLIVLITKGLDRQRIDSSTGDVDFTLPGGGTNPTGGGTSGGAALDPSSVQPSSAAPNGGGQAVTQPSSAGSKATTPSASSGGQAADSVLSGYIETRNVSAGNYKIGVDIPAGTVDITAVSGHGSLASSDGLLAVSDFSGSDRAKKNGVVLTDGAYLTVSGSLKLEVQYTTAPQLNEDGEKGNAVYTLAGGLSSDFAIGKDLPAGIYNIAVLSGYGEVVTSDAASGTGISGMMGLADGGGNYQQSAGGIVLNDGVTMTVRNCTITLTKVG